MEKYRKIKVIGKGSFGHAVLVQSVNDPNKLYIMKIIDISKMERKQKEEALNEVHVLKAMRHPFIVTYRESFVEKRCLCIVMDYADGGDLYTKIAKQKEKGELFPEKQILDWFVQIALALKHVHDRKILHRDIKTQNIFLTSKGDIKLGDFGIARILQNTDDCAKTAIGTPYYLSPEICQERPYNQKSDIWSLGCILYEMATLNHAFDADDMKNLVLKILNGTYSPISSKYSDEMKQLISEMLIKDPAQRPSIKKILQKEFLTARINELLMNSIAIHTSTYASKQTKYNGFETEKSSYNSNPNFRGFHPISDRENISPEKRKVKTPDPYSSCQSMNIIKNDENNNTNTNTTTKNPNSNINLFNQQKDRNNSGDKYVSSRKFGNEYNGKSSGVIKNKLPPSNIQGTMLKQYSADGLSKYDENNRPRTNSNGNGGGVYGPSSGINNAGGCCSGGIGHNACGSGNAGASGGGNQINHAENSQIIINSVIQENLSFLKMNCKTPQKSNSFKVIASGGGVSLAGGSNSVDHNKGSIRIINTNGNNKTPERECKTRQNNPNISSSPKPGTRDKSQNDPKRKVNNAKGEEEEERVEVEGEGEAENLNDTYISPEVGMIKLEKETNNSMLSKQIDSLRLFLEKELLVDRFKKAYACIKNGLGDDNSKAKIFLDDIGPQYRNLIKQLIYLENQYYATT